MNNPVRIGLVGLGRAGWGMHLKELADKGDQFVVVAACELIEERREAMEKRRVTQTSLSEQLGMNKSTLKLKLNGAREFKLSELSDIAEILHLIIIIGV